MDGTVLVALVGVLVLGFLGIIALTKKGMVYWESHTDNSLNKIEIAGGGARQKRL